MGQALYRRYRPKKLDEVVGQDHITTTLKNAIKSGKISHAYLFTGPKGVGKTSVARILAHEVNNFDYDDNLQLDIIEIDAASNRRIDEIRDLRDKVHIAPSSGQYKVYIIDEVHMLTKEAFNALLKTLEEPPAHVIFILATTESHKLPETIVSRTQRFTFKPIDTKYATDHLNQVAKQEDIKVDDDALALIVEHGDGSFRDSLSLLDQASSTGRAVDVESVKKLLGIAPKEAIDNLITSMNDGQPKELVDNLYKLEEQGFQAASIAKQLSENLRQQLIEGSGELGSDSVLRLLQSLLDVPASSNPDKLLEVILLDVAFHNYDEATPKSVKKPVESVILSDNEESASEIKAEPLPPRNSVKDNNEATKDNQIKESSAAKTSTNIFTIDQWPSILDNIRINHNTLYGILRMSQPSYDNEVLTLSFKFSFHQKRIGEPKMQQLINSIFSSMGYQPVKIVAVIAEKAEPAKPKPEPKPAVDVAAISNIFGDAEVLES